ncbi:NAD(P)-bd-dom domain-containing protein [Mycena kentingensis (nom. inval.)]|nr:NAD(P)-bd-dom domain-containing protein [Mycena kentingensis (nom. inval.)]
MSSSLRACERAAIPSWCKSSASGHVIRRAALPTLLLTVDDLMHLLLTGATGTIGNGVLRVALADPRVTRISILSRRDFTLPQGIDHSKAEVIVHTDYTQYPATLLDRLKAQGCSGCIWSLGIPQNQVTKDEYIRITYDYPMAAAKAFSSLSDRFNFVYVSAGGADQQEKAWSLYGKVKGRAERDLRGLCATKKHASLRVYNVRPGPVDPAPGHQRPSFNPFVGAGREAVMGLFRTFASAYVSVTDEMGEVFVGLAAGNGDPIPPGVGIEDGGWLMSVQSIHNAELGNALSLDS